MEITKVKTECCPKREHLQQKCDDVVPLINQARDGTNAWDAPTLFQIRFNQVKHFGGTFGSSVVR
jgi:hypothetical protein